MSGLPADLSSTPGWVPGWTVGGLSSTPRRRIEADLAEEADRTGESTNPGTFCAPSAIDVEHLLEELASARQEIAGLRAETERLRAARSEAGSTPAHRSQRAPSLFPPAEKTSTAVDRRSSREDKVRLFRSLFAGRTDVYAERWEDRMGTKSGWSPVRLNRPGPRPSSPPQYIPVDDAIIASHLSGSRTAGVYPLIEGDRCWFLGLENDMSECSLM